MKSTVHGQAKIISAFATILVPLLAIDTFAADPPAAAAPTPAGNGASCEADVSYSWQKTPPPPKGNEAPTAPTEPVDVFFTKVFEFGATRQEAEAKLMSRLPEVQTKALFACEEEHQNQGACVLSKLRTFRPAFTTLDFETRRSVMESVKEDCARAIGVCTNTKSSEVTCQENAPAAPPPEAEKKK